MRSEAMVAAALLWAAAAAAGCGDSGKATANPCPGGICVGVDDVAGDGAAGGDAAGTCAGVICTTPPSACHASAGACVEGQCVYALAADKPCDDGNGCTTGDVCVDGVCGGSPVACDSPPAAACADADTSRLYAPQGTCSEGACAYAESTVSCPGRCGSVDAGRCPDPCAGVACDAPPPCRAGPGTCSGGACTYAIDAAASCDDGDPCTAGDACTATGACAGAAVVCDSAPAAACDGADTSVVYNPQGTCGADGCAYTANQVSCPGACGSAQAGLCPDPCAGVTCATPPGPCYEAAGACADGACVYPTKAAGTGCDDGNACTSGDACAADGACAGAPLACDSAPAPECVDGDTSRVYSGPGTCAAGSCAYPSTDVGCPGSCGASQAGLCPDPCDGVSCDSPPGPCYQATGTCSGGVCSYPALAAGGSCDDGNACTTADACQAGGACLGAALACDSPPATSCADAATRRTFSAVGASCAGGTCDYPFTDTACPGGCADGACQGACDEAGCGAWELPATPDGSAVRTCSDAACATTKPLPAGLDFNYFKCFVQPTLTISCAQIGCHSEQTPARRLRLYGRMMSRVAPLLTGKHGDGPHDATCTAGNCDVDPLSAFEWDWNFDSARLLADEASPAAEVELAKQPLASAAGGLQHDGFEIFASAADVRYQTLLAWLGGATAAADCGGQPLPTTNTGAAAQLDDYGCPNCFSPTGNLCPGVPSGQTPYCDPAACAP